MSLEHQAHVCHAHLFCNLLVVLNRLVSLSFFYAHSWYMMIDNVKCSLGIASFVYILYFI
jgi:hypothetical protein